MIILLTIIGYLTLYMLGGFALVKYDTPRSIARHSFTDSVREERWDPNYYRKGEGGYRSTWVDVEKIERDKVTEDQYFNQFLWPVMLWLRIIGNSTNKAMDKVDPVVLARLKKRQSELEKELDEAADRELKSIEEKFERKLKIAAMQQKISELEV